MKSSSNILSLKSHLEAICGKENVFTTEEVLKAYGSDHTEDLSFPPQILVKPGSTEEVSAILSLSYEVEVPVTPIGALTGLSGGALSVKGGIGLSLERMNKILKIDTNNMQVTTQPAVITQLLQEEVAKYGLYYAPDPASRGTCSIGGNLAENSGGPRALKYGVTKDFVLNLEVVLPNGEIIQTGANTLKNSTGYNLTQLLVGSEGTLGVITKAVLKLLPLPKHNLLMLVPFSSAFKACEAVAAIFNAGITPSALEFMERDAIDWTLDFVDSPPQLEIKEHHQAHLLIEVDGNDQEVLFKDCEKISEVVQRYEADEVMFADSEAQKEALWFLRRRVGEAVKANSIYKEEDTVVPRFELPKLLEGVKRIGEKYGFKSVCYGHAGDGNLHINIVKADMTDQQWSEELPKGIRELFQLTVDLGGTISGEHGIGYVQKGYMDIPFSKVELELMKKIKKVFDPKGLLNPGKIWE
ncbi:FAD-binding oxidoreductase [Parvicella tangerina]|uniref:FAD-linked oxidoreductase n=1 Tax=Parvicella tangerina TaxID=2829795 RepID=A0A916JN32_9FLAO|nr:FAD-linked oxidase C-terminal domain-containing protein [Parvicella tangerina]CAG5083257.1 putative FAD-linked oxidoreductase [Parvicella tangerina]